MVRTKSYWPVRASNNSVSLARTGPTVPKSRRASGPVLIVEACVANVFYNGVGQHYFEIGMI